MKQSFSQAGDETEYASDEPCPYGMFQVRRPTRDEPIPHTRRMKFQPYPWYDAVARVKEEA